ncbi:hypothetical protein AB6N24_06385 [Cellulomonas sp. 179-A 4D5 NHS]|uniref:hypothetical protein n=1 Tax=Cellulomonas sp. 179-A 4D5 NHS TaxID=3142378 RepID=UPI0039A284D4
MAAAVVLVARRQQWWLVCGVLILMAGTSSPAAVALVLLGGFVAIATIGIGCQALGLDPFNLLSWPNLLTVRWRQLGVAAGSFLVTAGVIKTREGLQAAADWLATRTQGDPDLTTTWLVCLVCFAFSLTLRTARPRFAPESHRARVEAFWGEASLSLGLACLALGPAALLANWAWNVLASVVLPLFVLSVRDALPSVREGRFAPARSEVDRTDP